MIPFSLDILAISALAPGLNSEQDWKKLACSDQFIDRSAPINWPKFLPVMTSRRLSLGARMGLETSLAVMQTLSPSEYVFASRHGELQRQEKILLDLIANKDLSPTEFMMSVHNSALGSLSVLKKIKVSSISVAAGAETFNMALVEAFARLQKGAEVVLLTNFESPLPLNLGSCFPQPQADIEYSLSLLLTKGNEWIVTPSYGKELGEPSESAGIQFLRNFYKGCSSFLIQGEVSQFHWRRRNGKN